MMRFVQAIQCSNVEMLLIQCKCNCNNSACVIVNYILYLSLKFSLKGISTPGERKVSPKFQEEGHVIAFLLPFCFSYFSRMSFLK